MNISTERIAVVVDAFKSEEASVRFSSLLSSGRVLSEVTFIGSVAELQEMLKTAQTLLKSAAKAEAEAWIQGR